MCKNAICFIIARGCFKLFVKSTLYRPSTIILCGRGDQKSIKLDGRDFFGGGAETLSTAWPNFFRLIFGQRTKFGGGGQIRRLRGLTRAMFIFKAFTVQYLVKFISIFLCNATSTSQNLSAKTWAISPSSLWPSVVVWDARFLPTLLFHVLQKSEIFLFRKR